MLTIVTQSQKIIPKLIHTWTLSLIQMSELTDQVEHAEKMHPICIRPQTVIYLSIIYSPYHCVP